MPRFPKRPADPTDSADATTGESTAIDVNAVVSFNLRAIRERRGLTQQAVADRLAGLTGHRLPQASISAMERGYDGERRRRFDAHELYLLSQVFDVPITYFFLPPPAALDQKLADTHRPVVELYQALLGTDHQTAELDDRLDAIGLTNPDAIDTALAATIGAERAAGNWHTHYRTWRRARIREIEQHYSARLDDIADVLADFATKIKALGPSAYLQSAAYRPGDPVDDEVGD